MRTQAVSSVRSPAMGYIVAVVVPIAATLLVASLGAPAFAFEHLIVLLAVGVAMIWGLGPAITTAVVATFNDNLLFREPIGRPAITAVRDVFDLILFITVAITVAWLVARARREKERAESARNEQDRLVATISHDLANPLMAIRGTIQFANQFGTHPEVDMARLLARLDTAAARATILVNTLRDFRAFDQGELALTLQVCDFRDVIAPVVQMFERASQRHPVALDLPRHQVLLQCDVERLQRVLENLVSNAIKYSPHGGPVEVSLTTAGSEAVLKVRDYGIGVSADAQLRIFERSYRAPEAAAVAPGLGLGLTISSEIVKRHGGMMELSRAEPTGSIFTVRLPVHDISTPDDREPIDDGQPVSRDERPVVSPNVITPPVEPSRVSAHHDRAPRHPATRAAAWKMSEQQHRHA